MFRVPEIWITYQGQWFSKKKGVKDGKVQAIDLRDAELYIAAAWLVCVG